MCIKKPVPCGRDGRLPQRFLRPEGRGAAFLRLCGLFRRGRDAVCRGTAPERQHAVMTEHYCRKAPSSSAPFSMERKFINSNNTYCY